MNEAEKKALTPYPAPVPENATTEEAEAHALQQAKMSTVAEKQFIHEHVDPLHPRVAENVAFIPPDKV